MNIKDKVINYYARIFGRPRFFKLNFLLFRLGLSGMGVLNFHNHKVSGESNFKKFVLEKYNPKVIFDVGCNEGKYLSSFLNSNILVHCFEPHPITYKKLTQNFGNHDNLIFNNIGLSNQKEETIIYDYADADGSSHASLFKENITRVQKRSTTETKVVMDTLDDYVQEHSIKSIDLLKIDTEGNEIFVLEGAKSSLKNGKINLIQFEFGDLNISSRTFFIDFMKKLENFNLYRLLPHGFLPLDYTKNAIVYELFAFQNIVAIRKDIDVINSNES